MQSRVMAALVMAAMLCVPVAFTQTPSALDRYLDGLTSWQAEFAQTVVDSRGKQRVAETGRFIVRRPGQFRWETGSGPAQSMVADGRNLWFYDRDLEQVTVKPVRTALTATPAMLLVGGVNLREYFEITTLPKSIGLDWVAVKPRGADAEFRSARLGFASNDLRRMEIEDKLGQKTLLVFSKTLRNAALAADTFVFQSPPDADLIGTPVP
ncbi:MAG: outer membrane lipoprotein chaperone LolA [Gammaproteobacteria bacterium]|nr:outer membrane lipoprotein chaperone LolA [Gammaproteobacteria bacterium]